MASLKHGKPWTRGGSDGGTESRQRWLEEPENPRGDTRVSAEAPTRGSLGGLEGSGSRPLEGVTSIPAIGDVGKSHGGVK